LGRPYRILPTALKRGRQRDFIASFGDYVIITIAAA
jgi:hypothetical protein